MPDRVQAPRNEGIGLRIPERESDCSGSRPSWYPFAIQVDECDQDGPDPVELTDRHLTVPDFPN